MDRKNFPYPYEPKQAPVFDSLGNVIRYESLPAVPLTLAQSDEIRVKSYPNELGLTADKENPQGFASLLDLINAHRNIKTSGVSIIGQDTCGLMSAVGEALRAEQAAAAAASPK